VRVKIEMDVLLSSVSASKLSWQDDNRRLRIVSVQLQSRLMDVHVRWLYRVRAGSWNAFFTSKVTQFGQNRLAMRPHSS